MPRSLDNGGTPIRRYELWVDEGDSFDSEFINLTNYNDGLVYKATEATDNLVRGKTYRFISRAINDVGESEYSIYAYIAFGAVP